MSEENKTTEAQAAPADEAPQAGVSTGPVELTVQDLGVLRSIIDVASQRGAFKANEMEAVGKTFNKLDAFLQTVQKAEDEAKASEKGTAPAEAPKGDK